MRLLLDTHAFMWFVLDDPQLSKTARGLIADPANSVCVSPASFWEIAIKVSLGKLDLHVPYDEFMSRGIEGNQFEILPIETRHTGTLVALPHHHRDPFDRLLVVQSLTEGIPLISGDTALDAYEMTRLW